jgi:hypothetical protein
MPVVFLNVELKAGRTVEIKALLNSGAEDLDLVLPESLARHLGLKKEGFCDLLLFGKESMDRQTGSFSHQPRKRGEEKGRNEGRGFERQGG